MIYETPYFKIYFGDSQDGISKSLDCIPLSIPLIAHEKFSLISQKIGVKQLACLNQTHGNDGMIIKDHIPAFEIDGDYLITAQPSVGIGVMTADCLPIIIYDQKKHVGAIVHAGWRGTIERITQEVITKLCEKFCTEKKDLQIFFGPSAKACCYEVTFEFLQNLKNFPYADAVIKKNGNKLYLDVPQLNALQLQEAGIQKSAISHEYNLCTICDHRFYSYRRQGEAAGRQISIISLHY